MFNKKHDGMLHLGGLLVLVFLTLSVSVNAGVTERGKVSPRSASLGPLERISTAVPFPRGLVELDGALYVLARGRSRGEGGVSSEVDDQAGTLFIVDPDISEPVAGDVSEAVRTNATIFAIPTEPPFRLWDTNATPPWADTQTDRPYCVLRFHEPTRSFFICAFSGIDIASRPGEPNFSKNHSDALLRFDLRTRRWSEVERHRSGTSMYPDPQAKPGEPRGLLKGPDNCLPVKNQLYAVAKDNSVLARYSLAPWIDDPDAAPEPGEVVLGDRVTLTDNRTIRFEGHSALAFREDWLYIGSRTTSAIIRIPLDKNGIPRQPIRAQFLAQFEPWDPKTRKTADLTDIAFDRKGRLYVMCAKPASVWRFHPDPEQPFDAQQPEAQPLVALAELTGHPDIKGENLMLDSKDRLLVSTGDGYNPTSRTQGTIYRVQIKD